MSDKEAQRFANKKIAEFERNCQNSKGLEIGYHLKLGGEQLTIWLIGEDPESPIRGKLVAFSDYWFHVERDGKMMWIAVDKVVAIEKAEENKP